MSAIKPTNCSYHGANCAVVIGRLSYTRHWCCCRRPAQTLKPQAASAAAAAAAPSRGDLSEPSAIRSRSLNRGTSYCTATDEWTTTRPQQPSERTSPPWKSQPRSRDPATQIALWSGSLPVFTYYYLLWSSVSPTPVLPEHVIGICPWVLDRVHLRHQDLSWP